MPHPKKQRMMFIFSSRLQTSEMIRINNTQYSHFLQQADVLRRSGSLCDAVISVESQTFRAHRLVLACVSKTLAQRLTQGDVSPLHCTLELFSPRTFQQVLDFMYTQALEVSVNDLCLLLRAARLLEMRSLEEQCQMKLDSLDCKTTDAGGNRGTREVIESRETAEERDKGRKGSPVPEGDLQGSSSPVKEANHDPLMEALHQPETAEGCTSPPSPRKRLKMSPMSATIYARDSVIASPATSHSSLSPPWVSPRNKWHPVNTLRRIAQNYSSLVAAQSLQPSQSVVAYPFSLSTPHMYPLLASSIPSQVHGSVVGYPGILHPYKQHFFTGSPELGDILKQGLLGTKNLSDKEFTETTQNNGQRYAEGHGPKTQRAKDCHHCSTRLLGSPWLQESTSTPSGSGEACMGHRFCERGYGLEHMLRPHRQGHSREKPYECKHCPKRFSLKHQLDTHHRVHTGEKPFECHLCHQRSRDYSAMIKHLRTHGGATPYQCTVCLEFCSSLAAMQKHVKSHPVQDFPPDWSISSTYLYTSHVDHTQT